MFGCQLLSPSLTEVVSDIKKKKNRHDDPRSFSDSISFFFLYVISFVDIKKNHTRCLTFYVFIHLLRVTLTLNHVLLFYNREHIFLVIPGLRWFSFISAR